MDKLSYSSLSMFKQCRRRWALKKLIKAPADTDYQPSEALNFGKAYHEILESAKHSSIESIDTTAIIYALGQTENSHQILACVNSYLTLRANHPLKFIHAEYEIKHDHIIGYVDTILQEADGSWWIQDLKTARAIGNDLISRLAKDSQLNLYASFATDIATELGLDLQMFKGCRYNVVAKPQFTVKKGETISEYIARVKPKISEYIIPIHLMNPSFYRREIEAAYAVMSKYTPENLPACNYSSCFNYFSPCEYFSRCHGNLFSETSGIEVLSV